MRGIFFPQLVISAQKWWQTIQVYCLFVLALVRFHLILLSSLDFSSSAFYALHPEFLYQLCFKFRVVARTTSEFKSLAKAAVFFREPLWNSKSARCLSFLCLRRSGAGITFPADWFLPVTICSRRPFRQRLAWGISKRGEPLHLRVIPWRTSHW